MLALAGDCNVTTGLSLSLNGPQLGVPAHQVAQLHMRVVDRQGSAEAAGFDGRAAGTHKEMVVPFRL